MSSTANLASLVVLISGNGSNLQAIAEAIHSGQIPAAQIRCVISDKPDAYGLVRAEKLDIPTQLLLPQSYSSREEYDQALAALIRPFSPNAVILAGFMRILSPAFVDQFKGKLLNIHPSLLPKYQGLHTHTRVLAAGDKEHGCTVHFVDHTLDEGPILAQARLFIDPNDTVATLAKRVHELEHQLYPKVIADFLNHKYDVSN